MVLLTSVKRREALAKRGIGKCCKLAKTPNTMCTNLYLYLYLCL